MTRHLGRHTHHDEAVSCRVGTSKPCRRRATRIAEAIIPGEPARQTPVCRRHGKQLARAGWGIIRAYQHEIVKLAARLDRAGDQRKDVT